MYTAAVCTLYTKISIAYLYWIYMELYTRMNHIVIVHSAPWHGYTFVL